MSISLVVTRGFGNGTLIGDIPNVVTSGYTIGSPLDNVGLRSRSVFVDGVDRVSQVCALERVLVMSKSDRIIEVYE